MGFTSKTIQMFVSNGQIGQSFLRKNPTQIKGSQGLKYIPPKLEKDVVQISQQTQTKVSQERLQGLVDKNLTLQEMADELNISMSMVRIYLGKYKIKRFPEEIQALKKYFSTTDEKEKAKAYEIIDKKLQKIAKKESSQRTDITFDDCLQDVRLRFFEYAQKRETDHNISAYKIMNLVENSTPHPTPKIKKVGLEEVPDNMGVTDKTTEMFEDKDLVKHLLKHTKLKPREREILNEYMVEELPLEEIGTRHFILPNRTKEIMKNALAKIKKRNFTSRDAFIEPIHSSNLRYVKNNNERNYIQVGKNYFY